MSFRLAVRHGLGHAALLSALVVVACNALVGNEAGTSRVGDDPSASSSSGAFAGSSSGSSEPSSDASSSSSGGDASGSSSGDGGACPNGCVNAVASMKSDNDYVVAWTQGKKVLAMGGSFGVTPIVLDELDTEPRALALSKKGANGAGIAIATSERVQACRLLATSLGCQAAIGLDGGLQALVWHDKGQNFFVSTSTTLQSILPTQPPSAVVTEWSSPFGALAANSNKLFARIDEGIGVLEVWPRRPETFLHGKIDPGSGEVVALAADETTLYVAKQNKSASTTVFDIVSIDLTLPTGVTVTIPIVTNEPGTIVALALGPDGRLYWSRREASNSGTYVRGSGGNTVEKIHDAVATSFAATDDTMYFAAGTDGLLTAPHD